MLVFISCSRRESRELSILWTTDILSVDPNERFETATDTYAMNVFEPLLKYDRQMAFSPVLATRWDIADGKTWRFRLRPGVKFHDGTPFTAEDVVFTINRIRANKRSDLAPYLAGVSAVRAVDPETVEIISDRPAGLLSVLSFVYILPKAGLEARGEKAFLEKPAGTGPYRFVEWKPNARIALQAFDGYWGGPPAFGRSTFLYVARKDAQKDPMWDAAKAHSPAILLTPSRASWKEHEKDPAFQLLSRPGMSVQYLMCNVRGQSPLKDLGVRRAVRAAIDYKVMVDKVAEGQGFPASQYVTPDIIGYDPSLAVPPFEPGTAQRLLAEAGYPNGLDLSMNVAAGTSTLPDELIRQMGAAGIRITKQVSDGTAFYDRLGRCDGDLHLTGWICATGDASELFEGNFYGRPAHQGASVPAGCGYNKPELDDLIDRISRTLDPEARRNLLQQAMRQVVADLPWIPLTIGFDRYALTPGLEWEPRPDGEIYLPDVRAK